jgi:hypothetical protein
MIVPFFQFGGAHAECAVTSRQVEIGFRPSRCGDDGQIGAALIRHGTIFPQRRLVFAQVHLCCNKIWSRPGGVIALRMHTDHKVVEHGFDYLEAKVVLSDTAAFDEATAALS